MRAERHKRGLSHIGILQPVTDNYPDVLNVVQVAALLGYNEQIIRQMAREGRLPAHRPGGWAWEFNRDEVLEWLKAHPAGSGR